MTLVLSGFNGVSIEIAEVYKKDILKEKEVFSIIRPVVEKMASIVSGYIKGYDVSEIYLVGGSTTFMDFEKVFEKELGIKVYKPYNPLLVTPLGIAMNCISNR